MASKRSSVAPAQAAKVTEAATETTAADTLELGAGPEAAPLADAEPLAAGLTDPQHKEMLIMDRAIKIDEDLVSFGQGNIEAVMKSSQILAAGVQDLGKHFAATAQAQMDETMATVKALSSVRSIKEAVELQTAMAKTTMEKLVAETGKLTDASMKLAEQTIAPITERVTLATEKFGRAV
jgi:phasin family protein